MKIIFEKYFYKFKTKTKTKNFLFIINKKKWRSRINVNNKEINLGCFDTEELAIKEKSCSWVLSIKEVEMDTLVEIYLMKLILN